MMFWRVRDIMLCHRFDLRPFLYNTAWNWQFRFIDEQVRRVDDQQRLPVHHFRSEDHSIAPMDENAPPDQTSAGSYGSEGNLGTNVHIKTEQNEGLNSCGQSSCLNEEECFGQRRTPENGGNKIVNPLVQIGTKRKVIKREWNSSKVKAVSLAGPSTCFQVGGARK